MPNKTRELLVVNYHVTVMPEKLSTADRQIYRYNHSRMCSIPAKGRNAEQLATSPNLHSPHSVAETIPPVTNISFESRTLKNKY